MQSGRSLLKGFLFEDDVIIFGGNEGTLVEKVNLHTWKCNFAIGLFINSRRNTSFRFNRIYYYERTWII